MCCFSGSVQFSTQYRIRFSSVAFATYIIAWYCISWASWNLQIIALQNAYFFHSVFGSVSEYHNTRFLSDPISESKVPVPNHVIWNETGSLSMGIYRTVFT